MLRRGLTAAEREQARQTIESVGHWLRSGEPARSVSEDLLGHQLRSLLGALKNAVALGRRSQAERIGSAIEACAATLFKVRLQRKAANS